MLICVADDDTAAFVPPAARAANEAPYAELRLSGDEPPTDGAK
jgi:hypothetical protein